MWLAASASARSERPASARRLHRTSTSACARRAAATRTWTRSRCCHPRWHPRRRRHRTQRPHQRRRRRPRAQHRHREQRPPRVPHLARCQRQAGHRGQRPRPVGRPARRRLPAGHRMPCPRMVGCPAQRLRRTRHLDSAWPDACRLRAAHRTRLSIRAAHPIRSPRRALRIRRALRAGHPLSVQDTWDRALRSRPDLPRCPTPPRVRRRLARHARPRARTSAGRSRARACSSPPASSGSLVADTLVLARPRPAGARGWRARAPAAGRQALSRRRTGRRRAAAAPLRGYSPPAGSIDG
jgi:hypothetical protein